MHKGKGAEKKIEVHVSLITAAVLLKRAREKAARNKKQNIDHEEKAKELEQVAFGKHIAAMKQRHHLAVWWGKVPQEMILNVFAKQYEDARNSDMWGNGGGIHNFGLLVWLGEGSYSLRQQNCRGPYARPAL